MAPFSLPLLTLLATAAVSTGSAASSEHIRGVAPDVAAKYVPIRNSNPPKWKCLGSQKEILFSAINDDYCDCPDGSAEPGMPKDGQGIVHYAHSASMKIRH